MEHVAEASKLTVLVALGRSDDCPIRPDGRLDVGWSGGMPHHNIHDGDVPIWKDGEDVAAVLTLLARWHRMGAEVAIRWLQAGGAGSAGDDAAHG